MRTTNSAHEATPTRCTSQRLAGLVAASTVGLLAAVPATALASAPTHSSASSAAAAVAAAAAPGSTVAVTGNTGLKVLRYTGLGTAANTVTVSGFGPTQFLLTDTLPIQVGAGCAPQTVPAGLFGVACTAPVDSEGEFASLTVDLGAGRDSVTNLAPARMSAFGGAGDDAMTGGPLNDSFFDTAGANTIRGRSGDDLMNTDSSTDTLTDVLEGGRGDDALFAGPSKDELIGGSGDDVMQGGLGADLFDGGSGRDHVSYTDSAHASARVFVSLDGTANDGQFPPNGTSEGDNVFQSVEDITGNSGADQLVGNDSNNRLVGLGGDDFLEGGEGKDDLQGGSGVDGLFGKEFLGAGLIDGEVDSLDGGADAPDRCSASVVDGDLTTGCEIVDNT